MKCQLQCKDCPDTAVSNLSQQAPDHLFLQSTAHSSRGSFLNQQR